MYATHLTDGQLGKNTVCLVLSCFSRIQSACSLNSLCKWTVLLPERVFSATKELGRSCSTFSLVFQPQLSSVCQKHEAIHFKSWVMPRWRTIDLCKWKFLLFSVFNLYPDNYQIRCSTCRSAPLQCRRTPPLSNTHLLELIPPLNSNPVMHMSTSLPSLSQAATLIPDGYVTWLKSNLCMTVLPLKAIILWEPAIPAPVVICLLEVSAVRAVCTGSSMLRAHC